MLILSENEASQFLEGLCIDPDNDKDLAYAEGAIHALWLVSSITGLVRNALLEKFIYCGRSQKD